jgi:FkbM family methyltransferase
MLKTAIQSCLAIAGYRVSRVRPAGQTFPAINVFRLAVEHAVQKHLAVGRRLETFWCVQIGAHDGVSYDPVREYITSFGFPTLLIEPQPDIFVRLRNNYEGYDNVRMENVAITSKEGESTLYRYRPGPNTPYDASALSSLSREVLERNLHGMPAEIEAISVRGVPLELLLRKHRIDEIGILQIDAEGYDFEIIKMMEFSNNAPKIINFEDGFSTDSEREQCFAFLCKRGYRLQKNGIDVVAYQQAPETSAFAARTVVLSV